MNPCFFCSLITKLPENGIYEDGAVIAILDIHPRAPGHTMVIPKYHTENILGLPSEQIGPVFAAVKKVTEMIRLGLAPDGFTIGINHGKHAGQAIDHLHIHIIPRWKGDGGSSIHGVVENIPKESLEEIKKKIVG